MADTVQRLRHTVIRDVVPGGLTVILVPKPGFQQVFAALGTRYGSIDREFRITGEPEFHVVPDGIAHFLEHKMFESPEGDVFSEFARRGASANAFTTFDHTTYLFSSTEQTLENLDTLLDFVQSPYFTAESVEKEKGIIAQEIRMYDDSPERRGFFELLRALYHAHPVRIEIAGTVDSIQQIDKDLLYLCYRTFYHPSNMALVVVGGFDPDAVLERVAANQSGKSFDVPPRIERRYPDEPPSVASPRAEVALSVSQPYVLVGWKDDKTGLMGRELLRQEVLTGVLLDALFGRSSDLYQRWIDAGMIDEHFSWEYEVTPSYGHSVIGGTIPDPDRWLSELDSALDSVLESGLEPEVFERCRRKAIGRFITSVDNPQFIGRGILGYGFKQADLFETVAELESITLEEANARLRTHLDRSRRAVSIVRPR
jgi:predicted Zn-dependent peptidase